MSELDEALRSLRSDVDGKSARADETRDAIVRRTRPRANKFRHLTLLAAAILFLGTAAWAGATGRFRTLLAALTPSTQGEPEIARRQQETASIGPSALPSVREKEESAPVESATPVEVEAAPRPPSVAKVREAQPKPPPTAPPSSEELDAYEKAHRAHFERNANAISLWDAYLQKYPNGKWDPEARYNRAICLLRSGDKGAAKVALEPFARGDFGRYRQEEARALLKSLAAGASE